MGEDDFDVSIREGIENYNGSEDDGDYSNLAAQITDKFF